MKRRLEEMTVGYTTTILGTVVTRWSVDCYETETWGCKTQTLEETLAVIRQGL